MPVTGCTWRSSRNAPGCWDRGEPPRPVRAGGARLPDSGVAGSARAFPCLVASGTSVGPGGRGSTSVPAQLAQQWPGMPRMPRTQAPRLGTSCACGDISVRPGASCAPGDGNAVPDGVECPRMEGHAPCRVECPRRRRWPAGCRCPEPEDAPEGSRSVPAGGHARGLRCVLDDVRARLSARTEWQEDGRVLPRRKPGAAVRTDGMPEDRRGASRRAGLAAPPGLTVIVTTRSHRKEVTGVPGQESLEHQSSERRGHPSRGAMDRQAFSRRRCWRSHRQDWGYPAAAAAGCCCYCCCHCLYRRRP